MGLDTGFITRIVVDDDDDEDFRKAICALVFVWAVMREENRQRNIPRWNFDRIAAAQFYQQVVAASDIIFKHLFQLKRHYFLTYISGCATTPQ